MKNKTQSGLTLQTSLIFFVKLARQCNVSSPQASSDEMAGVMDEQINHRSMNRDQSIAFKPSGTKKREVIVLEVEGSLHPQLLHIL